MGGPEGPRGRTPAVATSVQVPPPVAEPRPSALRLLVVGPRPPRSAPTGTGEGYGPRRAPTAGRGATDEGGVRPTRPTPGPGSTSTRRPTKPKETFTRRVRETHTRPGSKISRGVRSLKPFDPTTPSLPVPPTRPLRGRSSPPPRPVSTRTGPRHYCVARRGRRPVTATGSEFTLTHWAGDTSLGGTTGAHVTPSRVSGTGNGPS